jgi:DAACS family dicarboxylate/amino acid:cation (Na+ or H+) symporter
LPSPSAWQRDAWTARGGSRFSTCSARFDLALIVLHWVIALVPLAVFCKVTFVVGTAGFQPFVALGWFVVAVITGLALQASYYLIRLRFASCVRPLRLLTGARDALVMAFSTASSTATMPLTYACLRDKVGLREKSASLGALVGSNFNNDGTALYEAMAALFIAQMIGVDLSASQQLMVVLTSVVASVGAAGIPEAGLVTMTWFSRPCICLAAISRCCCRWTGFSIAAARPLTSWET